MSADLSIPDPLAISCELSKVARDIWGNYINKLAVALGALLCAVAPASAQTIASNGGQVGGGWNSVLGQSFTIGGAPGDTFSTVRISFVNQGTGGPAAWGTMYLFTDEYSGTPSNLGAATGSPTFLGTATASDNSWTFNLTTPLVAGQDYYGYTNTNASTAGLTIRQGSAYAGGQMYSAGFPGQAFAPQTGDLAFTVDAVPEPATWAMMIGGFAVAGGAVRRRRKVAATG